MRVLQFDVQLLVNCCVRVRVKAKLDHLIALLKTCLLANTVNCFETI